jgi:hypothetical protein
VQTAVFANSRNEIVKQLMNSSDPASFMKIKIVKQLRKKIEAIKLWKIFMAKQGDFFFYEIFKAPSKIRWSAWQKSPYDSMKPSENITDRPNTNQQRS